MTVNFAQQIIGRKIAPQNFGGGFLHAPKVQIFEVIPFLDRISSSNFLSINKIFATDAQPYPEDERSIVIPLDQPINDDILAIRFKGIYPKVAKNGVVEPYTAGRGLQNIFFTAIGTELKCEYGGDGPYSPYGTLSSKNLEREAKAALLLGPQITDTLLGFGIYPRYTFNTAPVGFAIYGMKRKVDIRLDDYLKNSVKNTHALPPSSDELARHSGEMLREAHIKGLIFGYNRNANNYGVNSPTEARLLDLETATALSSVPREARSLLIYVDLARTIRDLLGSSSYGDWPWQSVDCTPLLPFFLWGYFKGDTKLPFVQQLVKFTNGSYKEKELFDTFGYAPWHGIEIEGLKTSPLIDPINIEPREATINLEYSAKWNKSFALFYAAIKNTAASIDRRLGLAQ